MHPDRDNSLTFRDLQIRVAELANLASHSGTVAAPPSDTLALDQIKRAINDAAANVARKASWLWLRQSHTITLDEDGTGVDNIAGDSTRYALHPSVQSAPYGRVTWRNAAQTDGGKVFSTSTDQLLYMLARDSQTTGAPRYISVQPAIGVSTPSGARPRMELRVWPKPSEAFTLTCEFSVTPVPLSLDTDRGIWPPYMDLPIVRAAFAAMLKYADPQFAAASS
ncbi:MAG: hypothetical protein EBR82_26485, partial [Caulobacteraceae bacterium]|nr:hypothetical protein [Caulobacteraceae bacterium]